MCGRFPGRRDVRTVTHIPSISHPVFTLLGPSTVDGSQDDVTSLFSVESNSRQHERRTEVLGRLCGMLREEEARSLKEGPIQLRPYQDELLESARQGNNVLIWLPTGTGKTYIVLKYAEVGGVGGGGGGGEGRGVDEWASLCVEVRSARQGNDVLIWLPTGTGKTYIVLKYAEVGGVGGGGGVRGGGVDEWASLCVEVRSARQGNDVLIWLPTGTGKTYIVLKYAEVGGVGGGGGGGEGC